MNWSNPLYGRIFDGKVPLAAAEPCTHWLDGAHQFARLIWIDSEGFEREHPDSCCPPRPSTDPPDRKVCACGVAVGRT